jgi:hypothetical protein
VSANDAWATGYNGIGKSASALLLHWNGTRWVRIPVPSPAKPPPGWHLVNVLSAVSAGCPADVMVTGWHETIDPAGDTSFTAFVLRWNGRRWAQLPSPESASSLQLYGTAVVSAKNAWVVGSSTPAVGPTQSLVLHWDGAHWTQIPSPY